ncbi:MAG: crossover junction endodeoxyribonuclease RuvC [Rickettsiella sp.]|nr:crossover junction endodeoxyribonuclease RuvC [Rickettsiella sp.]
MTIILGIDPGSRFTGYGIIHREKSQLIHLDSGCIKLGTCPFSERLEKIFNGLQALLHQYKPTEAAIEQVFFHINPNVALKLGQARGAAMVAAAVSKLSISEYSARQIKQSVVGYGAANKEQVQHMVRILLNLTNTPQTDAADALAVAICHAQSTLHQTFSVTQQMRLQQRFRRGRLR